MGGLVLVVVRDFLNFLVLSATLFPTLWRTVIPLLPPPFLVRSGLVFVTGTAGVEVTLSWWMVAESGWLVLIDN